MLYAVLFTDDPDHAVKICASSAQVLHGVLTDVVMPGTSGVALAERLRSLRPGLKVLFMSGYTDRQIGDLSKLSESAAFINKPFTPEEFREAACANIGTKFMPALDRNGQPVRSFYHTSVIYLVRPF